MNQATLSYFNERDDRPPPGMKPMRVRQVVTKRFGPYTIMASTSCGPERHNQLGSAKISLYDQRVSTNDPVAVKRFGGASWPEVLVEVGRLKRGLRGG